VRVVKNTFMDLLIGSFHCFLPTMSPQFLVSILLFSLCELLAFICYYWYLKYGSIRRKLHVFGFLAVFLFQPFFICTLIAGLWVDKAQTFNDTDPYFFDKKWIISLGFIFSQMATFFYSLASLELLPTVVIKMKEKGKIITRFKIITVVLFMTAIPMFTWSFVSRYRGEINPIPFGGLVLIYFPTYCIILQETVCIQLLKTLSQNYKELNIKENVNFSSPGYFDSIQFIKVKLMGVIWIGIISNFVGSITVSLPTMDDHRGIFVPHRLNSPVYFISISLFTLNLFCMTYFIFHLKDFSNKVKSNNTSKNTGKSNT
jgi:hypothetical protein